MFTFPPSDTSSPAKPCSVPYWDLLHAGVQEKVEFPLPLRHMLLSLLPKPDPAGSTAWSLPAPVRPDLLRQSVSVPEGQDSGGGPSSRWVRQSIGGLMAVTVCLKQGTKHWLPQLIKQRFTESNPADEADSTFPLSSEACCRLTLCFQLLLVLSCQYVCHFHKSYRAFQSFTLSVENNQM